MAYPVTTATLVDKFRKANLYATRLKQQVTGLRNASAAGDTVRRDYFLMLSQLREAITVWNATKAITGIGQYAKDQFSDQSLDIAAEFNAMVAAAGDLADWIFNNLPTDAGTGGAIERVVASNGVETLLTFSTAQTASFRTEADTFTATIS